MDPINRRKFLQTGFLASGAVLLAGKSWGKNEAAQPSLYQAPMVSWPEKKPLIMHSNTPPLLETPREVFATAITPNDRFFVRWHHAVIPQSIDLKTWALRIEGNVDSPVSLTLQDLKTRFEPVEFVAVKQCAGNSRSNFKPITGGIQWGHGAMGCALWKGARLKDVLQYARIKANSQFIAVNGLERPTLPTTPPFVRKLDIDESMRDDVIIAYAMNGSDIPLLNGYPVVLVVPGYFADNWVKMLERIVVLDKDEPVFYTDKAYRMPDTNPFGAVEPGGEMPQKTRPVKALKIKSVIAKPSPNAEFRRGAHIEMTGVAFDSGMDIRDVLVSVDGGLTWTSSHLDRDLGRYAFRKWNYRFISKKRGPCTLMCRAINRLGETQPLARDMGWNPSGYQWNAADSVTIQII
ncbi:MULTISPECIES: molybdopterin-dependent oxidoreductase [Methylococcus]|uniref:Molybdopterin-dependent oxidoreductase n=1 Tax=Methylococcus capsulatus TaxID=414 RepID=A0ABZ2F2S4_METCP|nr:MULTISPECIES: molybdopterin-dependent oxidoreductase [Methylococcus]MDF9392190.1 sulfite:cytochrome C oxidoreductase subunit A [Methylococcus capsulatus]